MAGIKKYTVIAFLIFSLFAIVYLIYKTTKFSSKATGTPTKNITLENSYLFATPLQAKADGLEKIRIIVFVLDQKGIGIPNQTISLNISPKINIENIQSTTDSYGKAIFDLNTKYASTYPVKAKTINSELPQSINILFY